MNKAFTREVLRALAEKIVANGTADPASFLMGITGTTFDDAERAIRWAKMTGYEKTVRAKVADEFIEWADETCAGNISLATIGRIDEFIRSGGN